MLVTTLDGNMAEAVRLTVLDREGTTLPILVQRIGFPFKHATALLPEWAWAAAEEESDLEDLRGNLLRNCFHMVLKLGTKSNRAHAAKVRQRKRHVTNCSKSQPSF